MTKTNRPLKTRKKRFVVCSDHYSEGMDIGHGGGYSILHAVCKTRQEAQRLIDSDVLKASGLHVEPVALYV